jgi:hypothetical protein
LLLHKERADYGAQVVPKLARDLGVSDTVLYRCPRFARAFPILAARPELSWAHYRALLHSPYKAFVWHKLTPGERLLRSWQMRGAIFNT